MLAALREADLVACEDTRRTRVLLDRYGVGARLVSYHEHNEAERATELVVQMSAGSVVALVSDAGMPLVSDPGFVLVRPAWRPGWPWRSCPGPPRRSARWWPARCPPSAGSSSGSCRASDQSSSACSRRPRPWWRSSPRAGWASSLKTLAALDPERPAAVCRELTKIHEEVVRGTAAELAARYDGDAPKGEIVLVVGPAPAGAPGIDAPLSALRRLVDAGAKPRPAAGVVAELTGVSANALYRALTSDTGP